MHLALDRYVVTRHWFKMGKANRKVVGLPLISLSEVRNSHVKKAPRSDPFTEGITIRVPEAPNFRSNDLEAARDNRPWLAPRNDAAVCNYTRKARRPQAAVWNSEQCQQALNVLKRDYTASSSKGPNASLLRTWESTRKRMNQGKNDYYPLTCEKITKVAAAFKACGYRSFANYLSRAKDVHISLGGIWTDELIMEGKRAVRSMTRGIGPVLSTADNGGD